MGNVFLFASLLDPQKLFLRKIMSLITKEEIKQAFFNANLLENYNFLEEDLVKLANSFINMALPKITKAERTECVKIARSLNPVVADKIEEIRGPV